MKRSKLDQEVAYLRSQGVILPKNRARAAQTAQEMRHMATTPGSLTRDVASFALPNTGVAGSAQALEQNNRIISAMRRKAGMSKFGGAGDTTLAIPRFYDPMEYWDLSGLPWNVADEGHRHKLHKWMRLYYATHYLVPILIDIFTRFPLVGMELYSPDKHLTAFYEEVFLDKLNYEDFLTNLGREYWCVGEAFALGSFNESLGIWEREELLNPEDIVIENFPLLGSRQLKVQPPQYLVQLCNTKQPPKEYKQLEINFPELIPYLRREEAFPVSDVLLKQVAFKVTDWDDHGTPILLRGLRTLIHEEKLLASQDAIAERLYSPLILAKLGIQDLGSGQGPWIPGPEQLEEFRDVMDVALSSDFRLLVHHFALEVENVFGRETVPDLGNDFDRIEKRLMQVFGINPSLLSSGANSQPYASSALQAEFMNQILRTFQRYLKEHFKSRALVVAEAQEHYDYEKRGATRVPIMERVVEYDEEGEMQIVEKHKLMIPDLTFQSLDLRDEATERQFLQTLRAMGVPISDERLMVGIEFDFKDSLDELSEEMIQKTVAQQMAKLQAYKIMQSQGLPIPPDLKAEVESIGAPPGAGGLGAPPGGGGPPGGMGGPGAPGGVDVGAPSPGGGIVMPPPPGGMGPGGAGGATPGGGPPPFGPGGPAGPGGGPAPQISNERRPGLTYNTHLTAKELDTKIEAAQDILTAIEVNKQDRRRGKRVHTSKEEFNRIVQGFVSPNLLKEIDDSNDE